MTAPAELEAAPPVIALPGLSIVLPCHNEAPNLAAAVRMASEAGRRWALEHEVIVVDDESTDRTLALATALAAGDPAVRVVVHPVNRGYGAALRSGIRAARMPWVLLTDADLQFDLAQLGGFVPLTADHDVIVGYRLERQDTAGRILAAKVWNRLVHTVFRLPVRDVDCAFKLIRRKLLYDLPLESEGATISTELLAQLLHRQARLAELGVVHQPRTAGRQSGTNPRVVARALRELLELRARLGRPEEELDIDVIEAVPAVPETPRGGDAVAARGGDTIAAHERDAVAVTARHGDAAPAHERDAVPARGGDAIAARGGDAVPAHGRDAVPARGGDAVPAHGRDAVPARGGDAVPAHGRDAVPARDRDALPSSRGGGGAVLLGGAWHAPGVDAVSADAARVGAASLRPVGDERRAA